MLSSNTNKLTWVGIAVGVVGLIGASTMVMFPSAMDTAKTTLVQTVNHFTGNDTEKPVAQDEKTYTNLSFYYDDDTQTAEVSRSYNISDYSNIDIVIPEIVKHNDKTYTVTGIRDSAFYNKTFKSIVMPNSITSIGEGSFNNTKITSGTLSLSTSLKTIGDSAFSGLSGVDNLSIPNSVTSISQYAFQNAEMSSISIGKGLTEIPSNGFSYMPNLTEISIPDSVTKIDNYAFYNNPKLSNVTFGKNVTTIRDSAFQDTIIKSVVLPASVTSVSYSSFGYPDYTTPVTISVDKSFDQSPNNKIGYPNIKVIR